MASLPQTELAAHPDAPITVLTEDEALFAAVHAAMPHSTVTRATRTDEAELLAATDKCAVLVTDVALTPGAIGRIARHIRTHQPALVTVAAGTRDQEPALIALMSTGSVDHVMLKPADERLARTLLSSAQREFAARKAQAAAPAEPRTSARSPAARATGKLTVVSNREAAPAPAASTDTLVPATPTRKQTPAPWMIAAAAFAVVLAVATGVIVWNIKSRAVTAIDPEAVIATNLDAARLALTDGRYIEPIGQNAVHFYSAVLALDPAHREAKVGIERIIERIFARAGEAITRGELAAAANDLQYLRSVRPQDRRLARLATELQRETESLAALARAPSVGTSTETVAAAAPGVTSTATRIAQAVRKQPTATLRTRAEPAGEPEKSAKATTMIPTATSFAPIAPLPQPAAPAVTVANAGSAAPTAVPSSSEPTTAPAAPPAARRLLRYVAPEYPVQARMDGLDGWVDLELTVDPAGTVSAAKIKRSSRRQMFGRPAIAAVRQWQYDARDASHGRESLPVRVTFRLDQ